MKKLSSFIAAMLMLTALCCAHAEHVHSPSDTWNRDIQHHWQDCECGERLNLAEHTMDDIYCVGCSSEIWLFDDGSCDIYNYDERGEMIRNTFYDESGSVIDDYFYITEYDANGNKLSSRTLYFEALLDETVYTVNEFGENVPVSSVFYNDDSSVTHTEYDIRGNIAHAVTSASGGSLIFEEINEYTYDAEYNIIGCHTTGKFDIGSWYEIVTDMYGNQTIYRTYTPEGDVEFDSQTEYCYNEIGELLWKKHYMNGTLTSETYYTIEGEVQIVQPYPVRSIEYNEDGSRIVYEYDENGEELSVTEYEN